MKSLSTLIGVLLLTTGLQAAAGDFDPWQPQPNPFYSQTVAPTPLETFSVPIYSQPSYQPYQPTYQSSPEYSSYDYAMDLVDKEIKRMGGPAPSRAIPEWQAYEIGQRNFCNAIQGNPAAQRRCFASLP